MPNITITIPLKVKTYLQNKKGIDVTKMVQSLLDNHIQSLIGREYRSNKTITQKIDELTK